MNLGKLLAICALSVATASCTLMVHPTNVRTTETVSVMPADMVDGKPLPGYWTPVHFDIDKNTIRAILARHSTLWLGVDDCRGNVLSELNPVFHKKILINGTYGSASQKFMEYYIGMDDKVSLVSYLQVDLIDGRPRLCGRLTGGSMSGATISSVGFEIR